MTRASLVAENEMYAYRISLTGRLTDGETSRKSALLSLKSRRAARDRLIRIGLDDDDVDDGNETRRRN